MKIDKMLEDLLVVEGGYVNHKADKGGPTKYGITLDTLSDYLGRTATILEVQGLDKDTAIKIYRKKYYLDPGINKLPEAIQPIIFDAGVNSGPTAGIKILQKLLGLEPDGIIGPKTIKEATTDVTISEKDFINHLVDARRQKYESIVAKNPSQKVFLKGWLNRAESFRIK